jgi:hypothetical protein
VVLNQKSDRYVYKKVEREFNNHCAKLELKKRITKEELFEVLVRLGYLKPVELLTSSYVAYENIQMFERICRKINPQNGETFELATVKSFIFALNYMWHQQKA